MLFLFPFISGEQLSLNVAGDSAKALSVLGNIGGVVDDCGLRSVQRWRRPPRNTRPKINFEKPKACYPAEIMSQALQSHVPYTGGLSALEIAQ
jgi:hypothetical protein